MSEQSTLNKLIEIRMTAMANALIIQAEDHKVKDMTFSERLGMLVDIEYSSRKNNRLKRLINAAEFDHPEACKQFYKTKYVRLPNLLLDMKLAKEDNTYKKVMAKYANPTLLILDEWLLLTPTEDEQRDIMELLHRRRKKSSTIFCSQYRSEGWYEQLGGAASPLSDAIIDRIIHDGYIINIESLDPKKDISMREVYGLDKSLRE